MFGRRACPAVERPVLWSAAIPAGFSALAACAGSGSRAIDGDTALGPDGPTMSDVAGAYHTSGEFTTMSFSTSDESMDVDWLAHVRRSS